MEKEHCNLAQLLVMEHYMMLEQGQENCMLAELEQEMVNYSWMLSL